MIRALELDEANAETRALRVAYELRADIDGITEHHDDLFSALSRRFMAQELPEHLYTERFLGYAFQFDCRHVAEAAIRAGGVYQQAFRAVESQMSLETITLKQAPTPDEMKALVLPAAFRQLNDLIATEVMGHNVCEAIAEWVTTSMLHDIFPVSPDQLTAPAPYQLKQALQRINYLAPVVTSSRQSLMLDRFGANILARTLPDAMERLDAVLSESRAPAPWTKAGLRKFRSRLKAELAGMGRRVS